jgi:hypothetical protein
MGRSVPVVLLLGHSLFQVLFEQFLFAQHSGTPHANYPNGHPFILMNFIVY